MQRGVTLCEDNDDVALHRPTAEDGPRPREGASPMGLCRPTGGDLPGGRPFADHALHSSTSGQPAFAEGKTNLSSFVSWVATRAYWGTPTVP